MIKYLIWDLDGTLFDTYPAFVSAFIATFEQLGKPVDEKRINELARVSLPNCIKEFSQQFVIDEEDLKNTFLSHYQAIPYIDQPLMPGARELCEHILHIGGKNAIVTHRRRASTEGLLDAHGIRHLFCDCIAVDDGFPKKPDPTSILEIIKRNGFALEQTMKIGDRELDVRAGQNAGIQTCIYGKENLYNADYFVIDFYQFKQFLST